MGRKTCMRTVFSIAALYDGLLGGSFLVAGERLFAACEGKSNPEIAAFVEQEARQLGCARPYIENLVFRAAR